MTNRIPKDTVNVSLNLPRAERAILGRLATSRDQSIGSLLRGLYLNSLRMENPTAAREITEARRARRAKMLLACGIAVVGLEISGVKQDLRRVRSNGGRVTSAQRANEEVAA